MNDKLSRRDKWEITIEAGLQLLPYVGGALSTSYFSVKQEKRFKRLESFYQELSSQLSKIKAQLPSIEMHDKESLVALIERINDEVEIEASERKRAYFRNFFISILESPTLDKNYDERLMFLETLSSITFLEFHILLSISDQFTGYAIEYPETDSAIKAGAISRLEMLGLLNATYIAETTAGSSPVEKHVSISQFGLNFMNFCLNIKED